MQLRHVQSYLKNAAFTLLFLHWNFRHFAKSISPRLKRFSTLYSLIRFISRLDYRVDWYSCDLFQSLNQGLLLFIQLVNKCLVSPKIEKLKISQQFPLFKPYLCIQQNASNFIKFLLNSEFQIFETVLHFKSIVNPPAYLDRKLNLIILKNRRT